MPQIPGIPTLDPVSHPTISPQEAGRPGEAIAALGGAANDAAYADMSFSLFMKKAQEHVDTVAASNQMDAAYAQYQDALSRTQNSRDIPNVVKAAHDSLNDISEQWSNSPASVSIQQQADGLRPSMSHMGTVRQADLMRKEFKIGMVQQSDKLAQVYASGDRDAAEAAMGDTVNGGVSTGLIGSAEAGEYQRQFRIKGQELEIRNGITNANPAENQRIYDDITKNPGKFADVTQEQLDTFKGQALSAFEAHTKMQDWAEGEMARKTQLVPKIQQFTNPATGNFDEGAALKDNADRLTAGEITETQSQVLAQGFASHQAQLQVGMKKEADKRLNDIETKLSKNDFHGASAELEQQRPWFENNGFGADYRAALNYTKGQEREVRAEAASYRAEASAERTERRQQAMEDSQETFGDGLRRINEGGLLTYADIYSAVGTGKGKLSTTDANKLWATMQKTEKDDPDFAAGIKYLGDAFPIPKTASGDLAGAQNKRYAETFELFQDAVNKNPDKSKLEIAHDIVKNKQQEQIKSHADALFGTPSTSGILSGIKNFFSTPFTYGLKPGDPGYQAPKAAPAAPTRLPRTCRWKTTAVNTQTGEEAGRAHGNSRNHVGRAGAAHLRYPVGRGRQASIRSTCRCQATPQPSRSGRRHPPTGAGRVQGWRPLEDAWHHPGHRLRRP